MINRLRKALRLKSHLTRTQEVIPEQINCERGSSGRAPTPLLFCFPRRTRAAHWVAGTARCLSWGRGASSGHMQNPKCERRPLFHSFGGFLNDVKPNLVSDLPVVSMTEPSWGVHQQRGGQAPQGCALLPKPVHLHL